MPDSCVESLEARAIRNDPLGNKPVDWLRLISSSEGRHPDTVAACVSLARARRSTQRSMTK